MPLSLSRMVILIYSNLYEFANAKRPGCCCIRTQELKSGGQAGLTLRVSSHGDDSQVALPQKAVEPVLFYTQDLSAKNFPSLSLGNVVLLPYIVGDGRP